MECKCISKQAAVDGISAWTGKKHTHWHYAFLLSHGNRKGKCRFLWKNGWRGRWSLRVYTTMRVFLCVRVRVYIALPCFFSTSAVFSLLGLNCWHNWLWAVTEAPPPEARMLRTLTAHVPNGDDLWRCQWETLRPRARLSCGFTFHANSWQGHEIPATERIPCWVILVLKKRRFNKFSSSYLSSLDGHFITRAFCFALTEV